MKLLVTGGAGFIGSAFIRHVLAESDDQLVNVDRLSYAGDLSTLADIAESPRYHFEQVDILDRPALQRIFSEQQPDAVLHLAAETHVDRSIDAPDAFIRTNVVGTQTLLDAARHYWQGCDASARQRFRLLHVSTDEVYGDLGDTGTAVAEGAPYAPSSPYAASKAAADHLVRAWHRTFGLPTLISHSTNNYGPWQFPEKLIPLMILNALEGKALPLYGDGKQVRDWLHVEDHVRALYRLIRQGRVGESYHVAGNAPCSNRDLVEMLCTCLDQLAPSSCSPYASLISMVADRPGHDRRYALSSNKINAELGWAPEQPLSAGLRSTVQWYLSQGAWCRHIQSKGYGRQRLGLGGD